MAELSAQDKALLRQVFKPAIRARLLEGDLDGAMELARLETKLRYPPIEVDWESTRLGKRIAARDAAACSWA